MGYMGLDKNRWFSDGGMNLKCTIEDSKPNKAQLNKLLLKEVKDDGNCFNPDGATHICLLIEDKNINKRLLNKSLINKIIQKMERNVKNASMKNSWGDEKNRKTHLKWYRRLLKVIKNE